MDRRTFLQTLLLGSLGRANKGFSQTKVDNTKVINVKELTDLLQDDLNRTGLSQKTEEWFVRGFNLCSDKAVIIIAHDVPYREEHKQVISMVLKYVDSFGFWAVEFGAKDIKESMKELTSPFTQMKRFGGYSLGQQIWTEFSKGKTGLFGIEDKSLFLKYEHLINLYHLMNWIDGYMRYRGFSSEEKTRFKERDIKLVHNIIGYLVKAGSKVARKYDDSLFGNPENYGQFIEELTSEISRDFYARTEANAGNIIDAIRKTRSPNSTQVVGVLYRWDPIFLSDMLHINDVLSIVVTNLRKPYYIFPSVTHIRRC